MKNYKLTFYPLLFAMLLISSAGHALEIMEGRWIQGGLLKGRVAPGTNVEFLGHRVRVAADGIFIIGLGRDAPEEVVLKTSNGQGVEKAHSYRVAKRQYHIQRIDGVPPRTVNPSKEDLARIRREGAMTRKARGFDIDVRYFEAPFIWPLLGPITGVYGSQRVYNGEPRRPHFGVDIAAKTGTRVMAPAPGIVRLAHNDMFFSGGTLIIDHGHGLTSSFLHLSKILVQEGDKITQGQEVAEVGATGRATGPHLDWRMNWRNQRIDPALLVDEMPSATAKMKSAQ